MFDFPPIVELLPLALLIILMVAAIVYFVGYTMSRSRPPSNESIIGHFRFFLKGSGEVVEGLTTTARSEVSDDVFYALNLGDTKFSDEKRKEIQSQHYYAVRTGARSKMLIVCDKPVESQEYSDSKRERRFNFPFGWVAYRDVFGYGGVFHRKVGKWDSVAWILTENLITGRLDLDTYVKMSEYGQAVALLSSAALGTEESHYYKQAISAKTTRLTETLGYLAEANDRADLAERRATMKSPFSSEAPVEVAGWFPKLSIPRIIVIIVAGMVSYRYLPEYYLTLHPNNAFIIGLILGFIWWIIYDNFIKQRLRRL